MNAAMKFMGPVALWFAALLSLPAVAQDARRSTPVAAPVERNVPDPVDADWPGGAMALEVDASDTARGAFRVTQTVPLPRGLERLTLLYPQWLPGYHSPRGSAADLAGLEISVDGRRTEWRRDGIEVNAFHVALPAGARALTARFVFSSALEAREGRIVMTPEMLNLQWDRVSLYPAGHYVRRIRVRPSVTLPQGWTAASALDGQAMSGSRVTWAETDYETLIDSPIFAGQHYRRWELGEGANLSTFADSAPLLDAKPEQVAAHAALVAEAVALFGSRHYDRYTFLLALSDKLSRIGLEHHRSSENKLDAQLFTDWAKNEYDRALLPHELVHSWNGKFRRPARLWTPDYRQPMQDDLLWLYEGQTEFWGVVLAARSGLQSRDMALATLASHAGYYSEQPGRAWRSIGDTTTDMIVAGRAERPFPSLTRERDYYREGALIWLEADQTIRQATGGRRSLNDFARGFFGIQDGDRGVVTYELPDVIAALNAVHPYDWAGFFRQRIDLAGQPAPLGGIERGGYRLVWRSEPNSYDRQRMDKAGSLDLYHSLGLAIARDGDVSQVRWDGPAFDAAIVPGAKIVAVNGMAYDHERMRLAIAAAARPGGKAVELIVKRGERFVTVTVPYNRGLRWPWLERAPGGKGVAGLDQLLAALRK